MKNVLLLSKHIKNNFALLFTVSNREGFVLNGIFFFFF